jgi:hypothetical protein
MPTGSASESNVMRDQCAPPSRVLARTRLAFEGVAKAYANPGVRGADATNE